MIPLHKLLNAWAVVGIGLLLVELVSVRWDSLRIMAIVMLVRQVVSSVQLTILELSPHSVWFVL